MNLILAAYHVAGLRVLEHCASRTDVEKLAVFTHEPKTGAPDLAEPAAQHGIYCSTAPLTRSSVPFKPDVIASVYYRNLLGRDVIELCEGRIFNAHPSLLPRHRGCSSIPWAIIEGDECTGVSFHYIDEGIDTGPVILQSVIWIERHETQASLYRKAMERAATLWPAALELVVQGFPGLPQQGPESFHPRGVPHGGAIDPSWPEEKIERFIRAMIYPPFPPARFRDQPVVSVDDYRRLAGKS